MEIERIGLEICALIIIIIGGCLIHVFLPQGLVARKIKATLARIRGKS